MTIVQTLHRPPGDRRQRDARRAAREAAAWLAFADTGDATALEVGVLTALHLLRKIEIDVMQNGSLEGVA